ncbi:type I-D CRISPR-associated helicase Cas3' [Spirulina sp. CS-785/01]|uniref:type I-D CRISPR-associated helicase Cas3' n=1 Tax=Spirulina sp. CS-785/01 TaxID=3021716 RepID=UPI00232D4067|nr:type I-D CRISPR-associated helicase Cas3' [Spirulina sp. CS-785/01]MDB9316002.1 type I-D CRISPR-associated helicase Cas3' [Spirulina sp. CS-785/01]
MSEYQITLKPVYSCPASVTETPDDVQLPEGWILAWHQAETLKALRNPEIDVVFNTAMTGDGKSLAAYLEALLTATCYVMGLYPTNELARDQMQQIQGYIDTFHPPSEPRMNRLSGAELEAYAEQKGSSKGDAIANRSYNSEILVTNPDIFHYLHRGAYLTPYDNPDKLWQRIDNNFDLFIFDEFHVFSAPQIASVINTMLLIRCANKRKKYLFLSATPDEQLLEKLDRAGFRYYHIDPVAKEKYAFPETPEEAVSLESQNWRQVTRGIDLNFIPLESAFSASELWLKENQEQVLQYFLDHPQSKGAIILNSIASVKRLVPIFQDLFQSHGLTVGENTGLSGQQTKLQSLNCDLVLGTSTIDVGVDFKINFLIFESSDSGNFIQRLGRLGRHSDYIKNGQKINFQNFTAYALVPKFLVERLFLRDAALFEVQENCDRNFLNQAIRQNYRQINDFSGYYRRWGIVQSFNLWFTLGKSTIKQQYAQSRETLKLQCEAVFESSLKKAAGCAMRWQEDWKNLSGKQGNPIFIDASSFRGSSLLQCGLYDETEPFEQDRFKTYDLPGILSNLEIETWTKAGFLRELQATAKRTNQPIAKGRFEHCLAFLKLKGYRAERLNWKFTYAGNLEGIANQWKVQVLVGIGIQQPENAWVREINQKVQKQGLVAYIVPYPVLEVRQRLQLPMHFALYPISDERSIHDGTPPYSIALGQAALLLDTLAYRLKSKGGEVWIC